MDAQIYEGKVVRLSSALGEISRRVVRVTGDLVVICTEQEYQRAMQEHRSPLTIAFRRSDVLGVGEAQEAPGAGVGPREMC